MVQNPFATMAEAVGAPSGLRLSIGCKGREPRLVELTQPFAIIGRSRHADVALADPAVDYRHLYLQTVRGRVFFRDLGSKTGTHLNGNRCQEGWLTTSDKLHVGMHTFAVAAEDEFDPADVLAAASAPRTASQYELEFADDESADPFRSIKGQFTFLGRLSNACIRIQHKTISRVHCVLVQTDEDLWVVDLLGKGGTFVDEQAVRCAKLDNGSALSIGAYRMFIWRRGKKSIATLEPDEQAQENGNPASANVAPRSELADSEWLGTLFAIEQLERAMIIIPTIRFGMFRIQKLQTETNALRRRLEDSRVKRLILDLGAMDYRGAEAVGAVIALARKMEDGGGRVVFCCPSTALREALTNMGLHRLWNFYQTREEALEEVLAAR